MRRSRVSMPTMVPARSARLDGERLPRMSPMSRLLPPRMPQPAAASAGAKRTQYVSRCIADLLVSAIAPEDGLRTERANGWPAIPREPGTGGTRWPGVYRCGHERDGRALLERAPGRALRRRLDAGPAALPLA